MDGTSLVEPRLVRRATVRLHHEPVLRDRAVDLWVSPAADRVIDGTVGRAGHSLALLADHPDVKLLALDRDPDAVAFAERRLSGFGDRVRVRHASYADLGELLAEQGGGPVDGILLDLGVSSPQLDDPARGFSFLRDGPLDMVATDHAPHHYDEKEAAFADAPNGVVGLETALGLVYGHLVEGGLMDLPTMVDRMSVAPARVFKLPGGTLKVGSPADVTIFDPNAGWEVDPSTFLSKSRNTPFAGWTLKGKPRYTIVGGRVVYEG